MQHGPGEDVAERGINAGHEEGGADWLARYFGPAVTEPVRLHVAAKHYLCAVDLTYHAGLSPASRASLELQGGPFSADEARRFKQGPYWQDAVALRSRDDAAKAPGLAVPGPGRYQHS
jgi:predicted HD phosphohydrolase